VGPGTLRICFEALRRVDVLWAKPREMFKQLRIQESLGRIEFEIAADVGRKWQQGEILQENPARFRRVPSFVSPNASGSL
jgi:hypothetical protein